MSNATGRAAVGGSAVNRRSAIGCEQKSSSTDKTNAMGSGNLNTRSAYNYIYNVHCTHINVQCTVFVHCTVEPYVAYIVHIQGL